MTASRTSSAPSPPRYGTPRRPERPTYGAQAPILAAALGVDLLPWQRHAADVVGELVPDPDTGALLPAYGTVVISVGRRAGKSLLVLVLLLRCLLVARRRRAWYTAQARADAVVTLRDEWSPLIAASPLARHVGTRLSNGSEAITVARLASSARLFAPTPTALHGQAGDLIVFDEGWAHPLTRGRELEVAARPLMATRPGAQTILTSAAGDIDSTWWAAWLEAGRTAAAADRGRGIAYLEWSADAPDVDLDDPETWLAAHPAVRHPGNPTGTITLDWLRDEHALDPGTFARVYLNVTDRTGTTGSPIDPDRWRRLAVDPPARTGPIVFAVDAAPDQASAAVVIALEVDGVVAVEVVDHRPGVDWLVDALAGYVDRWPVHTVAIDPGGPAGAVHRRLVAAGIPLDDLNLRDVTAAAAGFVAAVRTGAVRPVASPSFDTAIAGARRRLIGDGSWAFGRVDSTVDVCPLVAATFAWYVHPTNLGTGAGLH